MMYERAVIFYEDPIDYCKVHIFKYKKNAQNFFKKKILKAGQRLELVDNTKNETLGIRKGE